MRSDQIALQLYTVREPAKRDFLGTLREVAAIGYTAVELAGLRGLPADVAHVPLRELEADVRHARALMLSRALA